MQQTGSVNKEVKSISAANGISKFFSKGAFILFIIALLYIVIQFVAYNIRNSKNDGNLVESVDVITDINDEENKKINDQDGKADNDDQDGTAKAVKAVSELPEVKEYIKTNVNAKVEFDHIEETKGYKFYVVHVYEILNSHVSTFNWYSIDLDSGLVIDNTGYIVQGNIKDYGEKNSEDLAVECVKNIYKVDEALNEDSNAEVKFDRLDDDGNYIVTLSQDGNVSIYVVDFDNKIITDEAGSRYNLLGSMIIE